MRDFHKSGKNYWFFVKKKKLSKDISLKTNYFSPRLQESLGIKKPQRKFRKIFPLGVTKTNKLNEQTSLKRMKTSFPHRYSFLTKSLLF